MSALWDEGSLATSPVGEFGADSPFAPESPLAVGTAAVAGPQPGRGSPEYAGQEYESLEYAGQEHAGHHLGSAPGESAEAEALPLAHESPEQARVRQAVAGGTTDVNQLTNLVFFARHPERNGRGLSTSEPDFAALSAEWTAIRDSVVRPLLTATPSPAAAGELWLPGAERLPSAKSVGGTYVDGPWRFVFHTIEGEPSPAAFRRLAAEHGNPPHLWAMPSADLLLQTVPLHRSAYALARPGTVQTNRRRAIQVEVWGYAAKMGGASRDTLHWLADRVLAPVAKLVPINLDNVRPTGGEPCYGRTSSCRMTVAEWEAFDGVGGHQHVPDNDHWDPGHLDLRAIATRAKASAGPTSYVRRERPPADHDGPAFEAERDEEDAWPAQEAAIGGLEIWPGSEAAIDELETAWAAPIGGGEGPGPWAELDYFTPPAAPSPSPSFVPPDPPHPLMGKPSALGRPCCLLASLSLTGTDKLGASSYAAFQPGILYTGKAGFVDLGHLWAVADATAYAYQQIHAAGGAAGTKVVTPEGAATLTSAVPKHEWLELARSIAYDDALAHEIWTFDLSGGGYHNSSFSPEDLCSNYLGTVVAAATLVIPNPPSPKGTVSAKPMWTFATQAEREFRRLLTSLAGQTADETRKAFALIANRWVDSTVSINSDAYLKRRNFTPKPWHAGHPSDSAAPAWIGVPFVLTSTYDYQCVKGFGRAAFPARIAAIKAKAASKDPANYDKP